jgi:hypothetical protein
MNYSSETPLTDFLIALVHDTERLRRFWGSTEERDELLAELDPRHREVLASGNLEDIQNALREENADAYAAIWIIRPINRPINT